MGQLLPLICILFSSSTLWVPFCYSDRFDGYSAIDIYPRNNDQINLIKSFQATQTRKSNQNSFQFVKPPYKPFSNISVIAAPDAKSRFFDMLEKEGVEYSISIQNYQRLIDEEALDNKRAKFRKFLRTGSKTDHTSYLRYNEMESWLRKKIINVKYANVIQFGQTFEKRKLLMIKIAKDPSLPIVWLDGGIHAREWIASSSVMYVIDNLLSNMTVVNDLLTKFQFWVVPLVNPDGYEYSHETHRLWRKNRRRYSHSNCVGVDMNRNFPYEWGGMSASSNICDDQFRGTEAGSESEIQAIMIKMASVKDRLKLVVSVHAFGQYILQPFSFSETHYPQNYLDMTSVGITTAFEVQNKHNEHYLVGRPADILYPASGSSDDFAVGKLGIPFSFTVELPDRGRYGFVLPPRYIREVGEQFWTIFSSFAKEVQLNLNL